jgi:hypothetical protein
MQVERNDGIYHDPANQKPGNGPSQYLIPQKKVDRYQKFKKQSHQFQKAAINLFTPFHPFNPF